MDTFVSSPVVWATVSSALTWAVSHWWHRRKLRASTTLIARLRFEIDRLTGATPAQRVRMPATGPSLSAVRKPFAVTALVAPIARSRRQRLMQAVRSRFPLTAPRRRKAPALGFLDTVASTHQASAPHEVN